MARKLNKLRREKNNMLYLGCNMYYQREREREKKENTPKKKVHANS